MAHKMERTDRSEADENSKMVLNRRKYVKSGVALAAIVAASGIGLTDSTTAGQTTDSYSTGFGEYA